MRKPCAGGTARSEPSPSAVEALRRELQDLPSLDRDELRVRWRKLFRGSDPPALPRQLVIRVIAYRLQAKLYGDLDRETIRFLDRIAREQQGRKLRGGKVKGIPPVPRKRSLKPGAILVREHEGELHRVTVVQDGFAWNEGTYRSLSEVARAITGTNWSGPRFFGLRDPKTEVKGGEHAGASS
jgi:hypothetical protein